MVHGYDREKSIRLASEARGREVPETDEQRQWLDEHITVGWPKPGPTEAQLQELDRRIADFDTNPDDWVSWEEVRNNMLRTREE